jgi:GTPase SAR1 family protein
VLIGQGAAGKSSLAGRIMGETVLNDPYESTIGVKKFDRYYDNIDDGSVKEYSQLQSEIVAMMEREISRLSIPPLSSATSGKELPKRTRRIINKPQQTSSSSSSSSSIFNSLTSPAHPLSHANSPLLLFLLRLPLIHYLTRTVLIISAAVRWF